MRPDDDPGAEPPARGDAAEDIPERWPQDRPDLRGQVLRGQGPQTPAERAAARRRLDRLAEGW